MYMKVRSVCTQFTLLLPQVRPSYVLWLLTRHTWLAAAYGANVKVGWLKLSPF